MQPGILIGSDQNTEWLLPWWWKYYSRYNNFPVAIADFGLSSNMLKWCQKKAQVISLRDSNRVAQKSALSKKRAEEWSKIYHGDLWQARKAWFKKPLACLQTPFDMTAWIDIDCEVCGPLQPLLESFQKDAELAIVQEETGDYNSGVLVFSKNAPFLKKWARLCMEQNDLYMGDQNALTALISKKKIKVQELNSRYNWLMSRGYVDSIVIAHWCAWGKEHLRKFGGLHDLLEKEKGPYCKAIRPLEDRKG